MLAVYPEGGSRYVRHYDNTCTAGVGSRCNGRRLTAVYYLGEEELAGDGAEDAPGDGAGAASDSSQAQFTPGALRIFHAGPPTSAPRVDVPATRDRVALFWSDERVPHAVFMDWFW